VKLLDFDAPSAVMNEINNKISNNNEVVETAQDETCRFIVFLLEIIRWLFIPKIKRSTAYELITVELRMGAMQILFFKTQPEIL
jgi:hypothetical protein